MRFLRSAFFSSEKFYLLLVASVAAAAMLPILLNGLPRGYDMPHHLQCAFTFYESILNNDFYPSWSLNRNLGYGGLEVRLYPPVAHYTLALVYLVAQDWHLTIWLTVTFYSIVGSAGVYLWARELMPARQAVFAGCVYAFLPYHLTQIYNTFFYAEFVGSAILPFSFWLVVRVCKRGKLWDVLGLGVAYAALILTHLPLTVIGSICLAIYAVSFFKRQTVFGQTIKLAAAVAVGLAASSFFWMKVVQERHLMAKTSLYPDPWLDYRLHFLLTPLQTFAEGTPAYVYESSTYFYDLMQFYTVLLALGCTIPFLLLAKQKSDRNCRGVWWLFFAAAFLTAPFSRFVWDALPFLQEVQFSWRWVTITSLAAAILSASRLDLLREWLRNAKRPFALVICGCIVAVLTFSIAQIIRPAPFIPHAEIAGYIERTEQAEGFTFWWTIWTRKEIFETKNQVLAGDRELRIEKWTPTEREFTIAAGDATTARTAVFHHPNWLVTINDSPAETTPDQHGALTFAVPSAAATVKLGFYETKSVETAQLLSGVVWLFILSIAATAFCRKREFRWSPSSQTKPAQSLKFFADFSEASAKNVVGLLLAAALTIVLPIILCGVYNGYDLPHHLRATAAFEESIRNGSFYPSWSGSENFGYGALEVRFYPPLFSFLLALAHIATANWNSAIAIVFFVFSLLGGIGMYCWAKEFLRQPQAMLASLIFMFMPYHLYGIYNSSTYGTFAGNTIIVFSFLFVTRICKRNRWIDVFGLGAAYAVLILTHLPLTVIGSLGLLVYALASLSRAKIWLTLAQLGAGATLGLAASSIYWTKMVGELHLLRHAQTVKPTYFDYNNNFLLTLPPPDRWELWFFNFILVALLMLLAGSLVGLSATRAKELKKSLRPVIVLVFAALLMTTVVSQPIWATIPLLPQIEFPWRWMTIISICMAILIAASIEPLGELAQASRRAGKAVQAFVGVASVGAITIFALLVIGFQLGQAPENGFEAWAENASRQLGIEGFWTNQAKPEVFNVREKVVAANRAVEIGSWQPTERTFTVESGDAGNARIAVLYYPHWRAAINDQAVETAFDANGALVVALPPEQARVKIWFEEPAHVRAAARLSLFAWLGLAAALLFCWRAEIKRSLSGWRKRVFAGHSNQRF